MDQNNPYTTANDEFDEFDEYDDYYGRLRPFEADGRLGRLRYFVYSSVIGIVGFLLALIAIFIPVIGIILVIGIYIGMIVSLIYLTIQRCHDFNVTGWVSFLLLIPLVNLLFYIVPGTKKENTFGYPPPPNTTIINIASIILIVLGIISFIAGIYVETQGYSF